MENYFVFNAVMRGDHATLKQYLQLRNPDDPRHPTSGYTLLMATCESLNGHRYQLPIAETLLSRGADLNSVSSTAARVSALHVACRESIFGGPENKTNEDLIRLLLLCGARVDAQDSVGTILHQAAIVGNQLVIKLAVEAGIDVEIKDSFGRSALNVAGAACPYYGALNALVESGCDLKSVDDKGRNFLHQAIIHRNVAGVKFAFEQGMLPFESLDNDGKSPQDHFFEMSALPRQIFPVHFGKSMLEYMNDPRWERSSVREWERRKKKPGFLAVRQSSSMERAMKRSIRCRIYNEDPSRFKRRSDSEEDSRLDGRLYRRGSEESDFLNRSNSIPRHGSNGLSNHSSNGLSNHSSNGLSNHSSNGLSNHSSNGLSNHSSNNSIPNSLSSVHRNNSTASEGSDGDGIQVYTAHPEAWSTHSPNAWSTHSPNALSTHTLDAWPSNAPSTRKSLNLSKRNSQLKGVDKDQRIRRYFNNQRAQELSRRNVDSSNSDDDNSNRMLDGSFGGSAFFQPVEMNHSNDRFRRDSSYDSNSPTESQSSSSSSPIPWFDPRVPPPNINLVNRPTFSSTTFQIQTPETSPNLDLEATPFFSSTTFQIQTPEPSPNSDNSFLHAAATKRDRNMSLFSFDFVSSAPAATTSTSIESSRSSPSMDSSMDMEEEWQSMLADIVSFLPN